MAHFLGIDVGTGSARAGIFDETGRMLASATCPIQIWKEGDFVEQSSENIWQACMKAARQALLEARVSPDSVKGIGFDATCSLAVVDRNGKPVSVSTSGDPQRNVIVWMDHRAVPEAERINATGHRVLQYVGGRVSPEMQTPKLLWLKTHLPDSWWKAGHFLDLPDYLTFRATGSLARSLCTTVCKWTYLGHEAGQNGNGWASDFWQEIGLDDVASEHFSRVGTDVRPMGAPAGNGLTAEAARDLGLVPGTPVGVSIIDAHAGGLGSLGTLVESEALSPENVEARLALIGGTSSCHMAVSREPRFIPGVWGPYYSAMIPDLWLTEGGQSATGALVDHVINSHARAIDLKRKAELKNISVYEVLNGTLQKMAVKERFPARLTREIHVLPYFHGNRSPRADATLRGMISGQHLNDSIEELALLYLATIQAIALGTRHIIEEMNAKGYRIDTIMASGGGTKNSVFLREHADVTGCRVILPREQESVLLGAAMLGAVAAGRYRTVMDAMAGMSGPGRIIEPTGGEVAAYHDAKYRVFKRMYDDQLAYREIMATT